MTELAIVTVFFHCDFDLVPDEEGETTSDLAPLHITLQGVYV